MNNTTVSEKAIEVQQAAANAIIAERENYHELLESAPDYTPPEIGSEAFERLALYPADPYEMSEITGIPPTLMWLSMREPDGLVDKRKSVNTAQKLLNVVQAKGFDRLFDLIHSAKFEGNTENVFVDYIAIIAKIARDQSNLAEELALAVGGMHQLLVNAKKDVIDIADKTIEALKAVAEERDHSGDATGFALLGALIGTAAAVATGGTVGIAFSLVSGAVSVIEAGKNSDSVGSVSVPGVLENFTAEIERRREEFEKHQKVIVAGLEKDVKAMDGFGYLDVKRKLDHDAGSLAERRGSFHATGSATSGNMSELYELATQKVPVVAKEFSVASNFLNDANGTEVFAMGPASAPWEDLLDKLQRFVAEDGKQLNGAAKILAEAAQDFAEQDGVNAKWVHQPVDKLIDATDPAFPVPEFDYDNPWGYRPGL